MFNGVLNMTLPEEVSTTVVTQENLELLIFLIHTKHKYNKTESWADNTSSFLEGELIQLVDKAKSVRTIVEQLPSIKAQW